MPKLIWEKIKSSPNRSASRAARRTAHGFPVLRTLSAAKTAHHR